jgi:hypothetical protein
MMLMGWGTLAVPTGIVTAEFAHRRNQMSIAKKAAMLVIPIVTK